MPSDESKGNQLDAIGSLAQRQLDNTRHDHDRIFDDHGELTVGTVCEAEEQTSNVDTAAPSAIAVIITVAVVAAVVAAVVVLAAVLARIVAWVVMTADACPLTRRSCRFQSPQCRPGGEGDVIVSPSWSPQATSAPAHRSHRIPSAIHVIRLVIEVSSGDPNEPACELRHDDQRARYSVFLSAGALSLKNASASVISSTTAWSETHDETVTDATIAAGP